MKKPLSLDLQRGFTLVEIAIVLAIIGIIFGAGITSLSAYLDNAKQNHTLNNLELTKRATLDYVMVNYHMPCPDTDIPADGRENRINNKACSSAKGTVPYIDIGRTLADSSDDYGNVFGYGVTLDATIESEMIAVTGASNEELYGLREPSYFANRTAAQEAEANKPANALIPITLPLFGLDTPPTSQTPATTDKNFTICKNTAPSCSAASAAADIEVTDIPAVIMAFNENGSGLSMSACNDQHWSAKEEENCNNDLYLLKGFFADGEYDDQIVTISAYEIKQQVLDRLSNFSLESQGPNYGGYEVIYLRNVDNANDLNVGNGENNSFYIGAKTDENGNVLDANGDGIADEAGDLSAVVNLKDGDDKLYLEGSVVAGGNADLGAGDDRLTVEGAIIGVVTLGTGSDIAVVGNGVTGTFDAGDGNDTIDIYGTIAQGAVVSSGGKDNKESDNDTLTFHGNVMNGEIDMGDGNDTMRFSATAAELSFGPNALVDGESGNNTLEVENMTVAEFEALIGESYSDNSGKFRNFSTLQIKD
ncbi:MAG: prepilin-type N-terminal cleavage/methylation domain-containing protein [Thiotrichales bacterium]|nr:prepilin-type N-terminal cleavage/methylation domain-containing protein [Thiotrichales bacterium]